jgi:hypothetical protein
MGSLLHGINLHDGDYDAELVVLADGWSLRLTDPYSTSPMLYIRRPGNPETGESQLLLAVTQPHRAASTAVARCSIS